MSQPSIQTAMLIDDESFDQRMYQRIFKRSGLVQEVLPFIYADEALVFLKAPECKPIDVIFLDINMPRMNGFEFLATATAELGEGFARMVVVLLTTSLETSDRVRAGSFPMIRRFINKPLTVDHLVDVAQLLHQLKTA